LRLPHEATALADASWRSPKEKRARGRAKYGGWEDVKPSADRARLAGRRRRRLAGFDHGGFQPALALAALRDLRANAKAGDQARADEGHRHHRQVGHAAGRKHQEIVHHTLPETLPVIGRGEAMEGSWVVCRKK